MIDKWFFEEIETKLEKRKRVVVIDPTRSYEFLIRIAEDNGFVVLRTDEKAVKEWQRVKDELFLRYKAEIEHKDDNVIFYAMREKDNLSFMFDLCFTHGCVDLSNPVEWLKNILHKTTGLQISFEPDFLLATAKQSIGKDIAWWKKVLQNLEDVVSLEDDLLPFLDNPEEYKKSKAPDVFKLFEKKLLSLIKQPDSEKPAETLAKETANFIFAKLLSGRINKELLNIYHKWLDSTIYSPSLKRYIQNFDIQGNIGDIWNVHPDHCFEEIDKKQLAEIVKNFNDKTYVKEKLKAIRKRINSKYAKQFVPDWWKELIVLFECDTSHLNKCDNLEEVTEFYTSYFHRIDRAIRILYAHFINEQNIIRPLQEYYENFNFELLQRWFEFADNEYKPNQRGYLPRLFKNATHRTAVIVGDGIRYEIARYVADELSGFIDIEKEIMFAELPSETEHNMSALYVEDNEVIKQHKDREKKLLELTGRNIVFKDLETVNENENSEYLVLTYKDIDNAGEKFQMSALKLFGEFENILIEKIQILVKAGYEVRLVTDHGFVLTGLLSESDKIDIDINKGDAEIHERYIRTKEPVNKSEMFVVKEERGSYNYICMAKNSRPFKSVGQYGFSHGGATPQEVIIPAFAFKGKTEKIKGLKVEISNKNDLKEVTGEIFGVKVKAATESDSLFDSGRQIQIQLYADNVNYASSNIMTLQTGQEASFEFSFNNNNNVRIVLIDATTKEQLDSCEVKKSSVRDLGGLM